MSECEQKLNDALSNLSKEVDSRNIENEKLKKLLEELSLGFKKKLDEKSKEILLVEKENSSKISEYEEKNKRLTLDLDATDNELTKVRKEMETIKKQHLSEVEKLQNEINNLTSNCDLLETKYKLNLEIMNDMQGLKTVNTELKLKNEQLDKDFLDMKIEKLQLANSVSIMEEAHSKALQTLEDRIGMLNSEIKFLDSSKTFLEKQVSDREESVITMEKMVHSVEKQNEVLVQSSQEQLNSIEENFKTIEELKTQVKKMDDEEKMYQDLYFNAKGNIIELESDCKKNEEEIRRLNEVLNQELIFSQEKSDEVKLLKEANETLKISCLSENEQLKVKLHDATKRLDQFSTTINER